MRAMPTVENAATWFNAKAVTHHLDVVDTRTPEGSTVRIYNADGFEFMTLKSDDVSKRFDSLYAILKDGDSVCEGPVGLFPFVDVQVAPFAELVTATRPYSEGEADFLL